MITKSELEKLLASTETYRVERTKSTTDKDKFGEFIHALKEEDVYKLKHPADFANRPQAQGGRPLSWAASGSRAPSAEALGSVLALADGAEIALTPAGEAVKREFWAFGELADKLRGPYMRLIQGRYYGIISCNIRCRFCWTKSNKRAMLRYGITTEKQSFAKSSEKCLKSIPR